MKKLLLIAILAISLMAHAQTITIGEGSGMTAEVPFNSFYNYSFTEQIFRADEIEFAGYIKAVSFRIAYSYNSECTNDIDVYLKNVSRDSFVVPTEFEPVTAENRVFSGLWTIPANYDGWITLNFDTPFYYNGSDNLMIAIDENTDDYAIRYFRFTEIDSSVLSYCSDVWNVNPLDLGSFAGIQEVTYYRANIKLVFDGNVGVDEEVGNSLSVYPNPVKDILYIDGISHETVSIYDATGRLVMQETCNGQLNIESLASGFYAVATRKGIVKFVKD